MSLTLQSCLAPVGMGFWSTGWDAGNSRPQTCSFVAPLSQRNDSINHVGSRGPSKLGRRKPTKGLGGKEPNMLIIGCDYHPGFQQIALVDTDRGELSERRLLHREEAEQFYRKLQEQGLNARVGMERFHCGKQLASYVGLVPTEESSGDRRRLGHISKQGNVLLRFLLVEAAQVTVRSQPEWRSKFFHLAMRRGRKIAKVVMARKLAVYLYWMWRQGCDYGHKQKLGSHAGEPGNRDGV